MVKNYIVKRFTHSLALNMLLLDDVGWAFTVIILLAKNYQWCPVFVVKKVVSKRTPTQSYNPVKISTIIIRRDQLVLTLSFFYKQHTFFLAYGKLSLGIQQFSSVINFKETPQLTKYRFSKHDCSY